MNGAELKAALKAIYGPGWRKKAGEDLGVDVSTITRQTSDVIPVQPLMASAVKAKLQVRVMMDKHNSHAKASRDRLKGEVDG